MKRTDIINNSGYWLADIQMKLFDEVNNYLTTNHMTRTEFATQLGVSKGYVSQLLNGEFNHRIEKLIEIALAIGKVPQISFMDITEYSEKEKPEKKFRKVVSSETKKALSFG